MFVSPAETLTELERAGYFTDIKVATAIFLAGSIHRPILLEGPAGAGKTELASSTARTLRVPLLRLQCYQGIDEEKAVGQYDRSLQELYVLLMSRSTQTPDWAQIKREITSRAYFMAGPLLEAIEQEDPCVLLIDEIDKVDYAFEAMLLELLSVWRCRFREWAPSLRLPFLWCFLPRIRNADSVIRCGGGAFIWWLSIPARNGRP